MRALVGAGKTFTGYVESPGDFNHNPWESFPEGFSVEKDFSQFPADFNQLPNVSFVKPLPNSHPGLGGVLASDRLPTYLTYAAGQRQFCWAHVTRNLLSARDLADTAGAKRFCREALAPQRRLFRLWHRSRGDPHVRGGPITRPQLIAKAVHGDDRKSGTERKNDRTQELMT